ncbi:protein of unknown function (plasmid) [Rhodovastum atsumiense]|nr:protein of unknown function [Rhodovastum atsumiense]
MAVSAPAFLARLSRLAGAWLAGDATGDSVGAGLNGWGCSTLDVPGADVHRTAWDFLSHWPTRN